MEEKHAYVSVGRSWSASEVERALWAAAMKDEGTGTKRKQ